jgi:transposase
LEYNLLFRWFVGLSMDAPIWNHSTFSKNRERLLAGDVATEFFAAVVRQANTAGLLSDALCMANCRFVSVSSNSRSC